MGYLSTIFPSGSLLGLLVALVIALPTFKPAPLVEFLGITSVAIGFAFRFIATPPPQTPA